MASHRSLMLTLPLAVALIACQAEEPAAPPAESEVGDLEPGPTIVGKVEYERACARCHDYGVNGAPITGDRAAWEARSPLWEGVLYEHAANGWLEMPAGGGSELAERDVEAAAEYMLSLTHPERTTDPQ